MEGFLRNAERILDTAVTAGDDGAQDCTVCITRIGAIRILTEPAGWSLPALAAHLGAVALYRVERRAGAVRVEGWSPTGSCVLQRELCAPWWSRDNGRRAHATRHVPECCGASKNDLSPQVRNS
ncbi:MAG TPA: hypothetical protein VKG86_04800 [Terracidiphilus sp.]|nr:hypothetical protein [Terracidiphilus sp.]